MINKIKLIEVLVDISDNNLIWFTMNKISGYILTYQITTYDDQRDSHNNPVLHLHLQLELHEPNKLIACGSDDVIEYLEENLKEKDLIEIQKLLFNLI